MIRSLLDSWRFREIESVEKSGYCFLIRRYSFLPTLFPGQCSPLGHQLSVGFRSEKGRRTFRGVSEQSLYLQSWNRFFEEKCVCFQPFSDIRVMWKRNEWEMRSPPDLSQSSCSPRARLSSPIPSFDFRFHLNSSVIAKHPDSCLCFHQQWEGNLLSFYSYFRLENHSNAKLSLPWGQTRYGNLWNPVKRTKSDLRWRLNGRGRTQWREWEGRQCASALLYSLQGIWSENSNGSGGCSLNTAKRSIVVWDHNIL